MASITDLPVELLEYVVLNLDSRHTINLAQTCKTLHAVAIPAAYHTITLMWDNTSATDDIHDVENAFGRGPKIQSLVRTLTKKPEYVKLVKNLEFCAEGCLEYDYEDGCSSNFPEVEFNTKDEEWKNEMFSLYVKEEGLSRWRAGWEDDSRHMMVALLVGICQAHLESLTIAWEFFLHNEWFPAMMKHGVAKNAAASEAHGGDPAWFANLKIVRVTLEEIEMAETWGPKFSQEQGTLLLFFYLPVVESLQIVACSERDEHGGIRSEQEEVDLSFEWPLELPPLPHTLTTLRLIRSSIDPLTIHHLLRQATNIRVFEYDCYMHQDHVPFQLSTLKDALRHIRTTLTDLIVRYEHYNNIYLDHVARETEDAVTGSLGPLHDFPLLTNLTTSLPVLFGIETATSDNTPSLAELLPTTLEMLTITDDLWEYEELQGRYEDVNAMAVFRKYLVGEMPSHRLNTPEPYTLDTTRGMVDPDKIEKGLVWVQDREPEWKAATPRLKKLTYDLTKLCCGYWSLSGPKEQLLGLCESQGIEGQVLL